MFFLFFLLFLSQPVLYLLFFFFFVSSSCVTCRECRTPKLKRFKRVYGTPQELSPKSRVKQLVGYTGLFDRHDWIVDRCGTEVRHASVFLLASSYCIINALKKKRYVIDFWRGKAVIADIPSIYLDVRPALDDVGAAWDHIRMWYRRLTRPL